MIFNLKNIKVAQSRNGYSFSATLVINGLDVCNVKDDGDGSQPRFDVINKELYSLWSKGVAELPKIYNHDYEMEMQIDNGLFIDLLYSAQINKTEFKLLSA